MVSADHVDVVKVVARRRVSPPPDSVPPTTLTLTYFDVLWLTTPPVRQIFFYEFPGTTKDFHDSHFTLLERSLSLAFTLFYPFAGRLVPSTDDSCPGDWVIRFSRGDSVPLLLAESTADFARHVGNQPKRVEEFHSLLPELKQGKQEKQEQPPLVAFQVTVFPRRGISVGITVRHVVADGFGCTHFIKSWASIFKAGGDVFVVKNLPVYDRNFVVGEELERLKRNWLETETQREEEEADRVDPSSTKIAGLGRFSRSTFHITRAQIQKLRDRVTSVRAGPRLSSFTLTCAYVWVCLAKSRDVPEDKGIGKTTPRPFYFGFAVDCRPRLDPPVPDSYAGNCIGSGLTEASYAELTGESGLVVATESILAEARRLEKGLLERTDYTFRKWGQVVKYRALSVAGTPRFRVYETDFGWGRPRQVEIVSIELNEAISLAESRDGEGGIEIGLVGPQDEILRFTSFFEEGLKKE